MNLGDRSRLRLLDVLIKKYGWHTMAMVGVHDDGEVRGLLQWCRHLKVTAVWQPKAAHLSERQRQMHARDRMRKWAESYGRLTLVEQPQHEAVETLAGRSFDAVALWGLTPGQLAATGASWAALVRDGGALVGRDHRTAEVRRVLNAAVPKWRSLRDGVWLVEVKRSGALLPGVEGTDASSLDNVDGAGGADIDKPVAELDTQDASVGDGGLAPAGADVLPTENIDLAHAADIAQPAPKRRGGRPKGSRNKPKVAAE